MKTFLRSFLRSFWLDFTLFVLIVALAIVFMMAGVGGCRPDTSARKFDNSIPAVGSSIDKAGAHVESADRLVKAAKPQANDTGKALLGSAQEEHKAALSALTDSRSALSAVTRQRDQMEADNVRLSKELATVVNGWGYRLQLFVKRVEIFLIVLFGLHYLLNVVALFAPLGAAGLFVKLAAILNPLAWLQAIASHVVTSRALQPPQLPPQLPATPAWPAPALPAKV